MPKAKPQAKTKTAQKTRAKAKTVKNAKPAAKAVKASSKPVPTAAEAQVKVRKVQAPTHNQIAAKAYEIWMAKGQPVGEDMENWEAAKQALLDEA